MANIDKRLGDLYYIDEIALGSTWLHKLHAGAKLSVSLLFIITAAATGRYALENLLYMSLLPAFFLITADIPVAYILKRALWALPFLFFAGLAGIFFDREVIGQWGGIRITAGWLSFGTVLLKGYLCLLIMLIFTAVSGINGLGKGLLFFRLPVEFVSVVLLIYRYIFLLGEETLKLAQAYSLRSFSKKGVHVSRWGSLAGSILIRSMDKAGRVGDSMTMKGGGNRKAGVNQAAFQWKDIGFVLVCAAFIFGAYFGLYEKAMGFIMGAGG